MKLFFLSIFVCVIGFTVHADNEENQKESASQKKRTIVLNAHELAIQHDKSGKTKKAIADLEKVLDAAKTCGDDELLEKTYDYLILYNQKIGAIKKADEYKYLQNLIHASIEKNQLENKNKEREQEIYKLKEQKLNAELSKKQTEEELSLQTEQLISTKDSLGILDLLNKERQTQLNLLTKEKELENLKVKEQEARLQNQELVIKEKDARQKYILIVVVALILGLVILGALAFFIFKNLKQKKQYSEQIEKQLEVIQHQHVNITNSINYARKIQNAMLPQEMTFQSMFDDSFILFKPKDIVSGDFFWFMNINEGNIANPLDSNAYKIAQNNDKIIVVAADCTGHGVPGALMSMIGFNLLNNIVHKNIYEPELILSELNNNVQSALKQHSTDNKDGMDMALCIIDYKNKVIEFAGAKNPMVVIRDGQLEHLKGDKHPIGGSQGQAIRSFTKHTIPLTTDTYIYLFSDGYEDQFGGPSGKKFMVKNLKDLLLKIHTQPFSKQKEILNTTIEEWKGTKEKQIDDILVMGMKVC